MVFFRRAMAPPRKVIIFVGCYGGQSADSLACIASWKTNERALKEGRERGQRHWPKELVKSWLEAYAPSSLRPGGCMPARSTLSRATMARSARKGPLPCCTRAKATFGSAGTRLRCWCVPQRACVLSSSLSLSPNRAPALPSLRPGRVGPQADHCVLREFDAAGVERLSQHDAKKAGEAAIATCVATLDHVDLLASVDAEAQRVKSALSERVTDLTGLIKDGEEVEADVEVLKQNTIGFVDAASFMECLKRRRG